MPTTYALTPPASTTSSSWTMRYRDWRRTAGFPLADTADLPVNYYLDLKEESSQEYFSGWSRTHTNGTFQQIVPPSFHQQTYATINATHNQILDLSGVNEKVGPLLNATLIKALGKVSDQKLNLSVALAEASKTMNHLMSTASRIFRAYSSFRRGKFKAVARELGITPNTIHKSWLEYKYGWMPLLMDVKGGAELLAQHHFGKPLMFTVKAQERVSTTWTRDLTADIGYGGPLLQGHQSLQSEMTCRVKLWVRVDNPNLTTAQQLGLTNPSLIVWETIPFSFVFDWFISVGDWLQALTALHGVTVVKTMESWEHDVQTMHWYDTQQYFVAPYHYSINGESFTTKARSYLRQPLSVSTSAIYPPANTGPLGFQKFLTSLALMRTRARRSEYLRI